jgi:sugar/nucleoside kinase (ribokinase family)
MMPPESVISIGDLVVDIVMPIPRLPVEAGQNLLGISLEIEPGGAGNFLLAGARLGMKMSALGVLGADPLGVTAADILKQEGVDTSQLVMEPGSKSTTVVVLSDNFGQHVFLGTYSTGGEVPFSDGWRTAIENSQAVFAAGYSLHETRLVEACLLGLEHAHSLGIPIFFDPGPEMRHTTDDIRQRVLALKPVVIATEDELPDMAEQLPGLQAVDYLLARGVPLVCQKRGPAGCLVASAGERVEHPGYPVKLVDTTAAGDAFDAAFIYACLKGWSLAEIAAFANAMGAAKVQKMGSGRQVPTREEVQKVLDEYSVGLRI